MTQRLTPLACFLALGCIHLSAAPPSKIDLTDQFQKLALPPRAQGARDTCSLFAVTALANFEANRVPPVSRVRFSEEFLVWAANEATGRVGDQAMFYEAVHGLNVFGICTEDLMAYDPKTDVKRRPSDKASAVAKSLADRWKVTWIRRWDLKTPVTDTQFQGIKDALAAGHPVACGLRWPKTLRGSQILDVPAAMEVFDGHSIALVGYTDDPRAPGNGVFLFRNSSGPRWGKNGYGTMSYAYLRAYANDALFLEFSQPGSEVPIERFEAERLPLLKEKCQAGPQAMDSFGGPMWSDGKQLFGRAEAGGFVELRFTARAKGTYRVRVLATSAPDFGIVTLAIDGVRRGEFDLYAGRVCPSGSLELGKLDLAKGKHVLRVAPSGRNPASAGDSFGIDAIDLLQDK